MASHEVAKTSLKLQIELDGGVDSRAGRDREICRVSVLMDGVAGMMSSPDRWM